MGRLNYGYNNKYLVTLTVRRDGFSGFGEASKYGVFPSVALAWNLSEESFFPSTLLSAAKLPFCGYYELCLSRYMILIYF